MSLGRSIQLIVGKIEIILPERNQILVKKNKWDYNKGQRNSVYLRSKSKSLVVSLSDPPPPP